MKRKKRRKRLPARIGRMALTKNFIEGFKKFMAGVEQLERLLNHK